MMINEYIAYFLGLGVSATVTGNNYNIKCLTGMKSFTVKGTGIHKNKTYYSVSSLIYVFDYIK